MYCSHLKLLRMVWHAYIFSLSIEFIHNEFWTEFTVIILQYWYKKTCVIMNITYQSILPCCRSDTSAWSLNLRHRWIISVAMHCVSEIFATVVPCAKLISGRWVFENFSYVTQWSLLIRNQCDQGKLLRLFLFIIYKYGLSTILVLKYSMNISPYNNILKV